MAEATVRLLEVEPDIGQFLGEEDRAQAAALMVPRIRVATGPLDAVELLARHRAFAALILGGVLLARPRVGEHAALRLLGPGEIMTPVGPRSPAVLAGVSWTVASDAELILLGDEILAAARLWPRILTALGARLADQSQRLDVQLVLCQLPRVTDRVLGMMWLLAEAWGRVTPAGVTVPLALTHEMIGEMIGARRPTVSLAVGELVRSGSMLRQDRGWLLLEPLREAGVPEAMSVPDPFLQPPSAWAGSADLAPAVPVSYNEMRETFERMRAELEETRRRVREGLAHASQTREYMARRRNAMATRPPPRQAP